MTLAITTNQALAQLEVLLPPIDGNWTHQDPNSHAATVFEIRRQERVHWVLGLRQAELFIREKAIALESQVFNQRKFQRQVRRYERELKTLTIPLWGQIVALWKRFARLDRIEEIEDELEQAHRGWSRSQPLVRDAQAALDLAIAEKERILTEHPEVPSLGYSGLQLEHALSALQQVQARFLASRVWAAQRNLPESVGEMVFSLSDEERDAVISQEMLLRAGVQLTEQIMTVAQRLAELPKDRQTFLVRLIMDEPAPLATQALPPLESVHVHNQ